MTPLLCVLLPLAVAGLPPGLGFARALALGCSVLDLLLVASLPWSGSTLGGWFLPDPLAVLVVGLTGFAWVLANAVAPPTAATAVVVGLVNLALLSDSAGLTVLAAGVAGCVAVRALGRPDPGPMLATAAIGLALALFGTVLLYVGTVPALGPGWPALSWGALPEAGPRALAGALGIGFAITLLGIGVSCTLVPVWAALGGTALPPAAAMLAGPLGGVWLVVALRLRGALDGNGHAIAPGAVLLAAGLAALVLAVACLRRRSGTGALVLAVFGAVLVGFGSGGPAATGAALLHLTVGCVALTAAATGSRLGLLTLAGVPPLGVFASGFALVSDTAGRSVLVAGLLGLGLFAVAALTVRDLPAAAPGNRLGWIGVGLALVGAWAMPPALAAWIQGIAAVAR